MVLNDTIIVFDKTGNSVLLFDNDGDFIRKIGNEGTKVDEYHKIKCIAIDEENSLICLFDEIQFAIIKYNFQGEFKGKIYYDDFYPSYIYSLNDTLYCFMNKIPYKGRYYDIQCMVEDKILDSYLKFDNHGSWHLRDYPFYMHDEKVNYVDFFAGQVIEFDDDTIKLKYLFDFGNKTLPEYALKDSESFNKHRQKYTYLKGNFLENEKYLQFGYSQSGILKKCLYIKKDNHAICLTNSVDDWYNREPALFMNTFFSGNNYLASVYLNSDCLVLRSFTDKLQDKNLKSAVRNMNVKSNPMVVIYYLK